MKERPILFKADMVRAILDGRKTVTRRVVKNANDIIQDWDENDPSYGPFYEDKFGESHETVDRCPLGVPGDRLWVRETWNASAIQGNGRPPYQYRADNSQFKDSYTWKPSIHMPRWASRINLEVVSVSVERLQDITEEDAIAEGINRIHTREGNYFHSKNTETHPKNWCCPIDAFRELWNSINGPESWGANPWVWRVEFKVVK